MSTAILIIGPEHDGQTMSLADFENAEAREGHLYELGRGVVAVIDVPNRPHQRIVRAIKKQLTAFETVHPGVIDSILGSTECKIVVRDADSERHPDIAVYKTVPPEIDTAELWNVWIPEIVVEVTSPGSKRRDYGEKPDEYFQVGIKEYWIVDADDRKVTVLVRSEDSWIESKLKPPARHTTHLLPGFELDIESVFATAK